MATRGQLSRALSIGFSGVLVCLAVPGHSQQVEFRETTSVVVVEIPVHVWTADGEPVRGLGKENFEIFDGRRKQEILGIEMYDLAQAEGQGPGLPSEARRHFLILFDFSLSDPESIVRGQRAARDLIASLQPADLVGVATYSGVRGVNMVLGFTSDRRQAELAVSTLGLPELIERTPDPVNIYLGEPPREDQDPANPDSEAAKKLLQILRTTEAAEKVYDEQDRGISMCRNLAALADLMAGIEGQKHVVYLSTGFESRILVGYDRQISRWTLRRVWTTNLDVKYGDDRLRNEIEKMAQAFRRSGGVMHTVNTGPLQIGTAERGLNTIEAGLFMMAGNTGGEFFPTFSDLGTGLTRALQRNEVTYLLAFQPERLDLDGEYHPLKIKLRNVPKGTTAFHRAGYYAPTPFAETGQNERRLAAAELLLGDEGGSIGVEVLAAPFPVVDERPYVPLLVEVDGPSVLRDRTGNFAQMELYAYAVDGEGNVYDFAAKNVGLNLEEVTPMLEQGGFKFMGHLDLPAGEYTVRVLARNSHTGRHSLRRVAITVPKFDEDEPLLLPPMFPDRRGKWMLSREDEQSRREVAYPFAMGAQQYVPAARPVVPSQGSIPVYLMGYNIYVDELDFELFGRVSSAAGTEVEDIVLAPEEIIPELNESYDSFAIRARLETYGLEPGEYTLEITVTDGEGEPWSSSSRFVVEAPESSA